MQARDANVANKLRPLSHNLRGNFGLGSDGQIGGACGYYRQNRFGWCKLLLFENYCSRCFFISGEGKLTRLGDCFKDIFPGPCGQDVVALRRKRSENLDYLFVCLAGAVNHLGKTLTNLAMVVNAGKTEVLVWQMAKLFDGLIDRNIARFDLLQQLF
jgi:hypothetical protein